MAEVAVPKGLVGFDNFKRHNPRSDRFEVKRFHHIEFWCGDATNVGKRMGLGLGMQFVGKSDQTTGNQTYASYVYKSNEVLFAFTAPYSTKIDTSTTKTPHPHFDATAAHQFFVKHGFAARAIGITVKDAAEAYKISTQHGAIGVLEPQILGDGQMTISEVLLYGDVVLRYVSTSDSYTGPFLPGYEAVDSSPRCFGLTRIDHCVGNVPKLMEQIEYMVGFTGWHEFAEFVASDVGTVDSGLNSMVLSNNNEMVLLPINEPTFGTPRKSQIQTYLEHNEGSGLQHIAIKTDDIIATMTLMRSMTELGGLDFMPAPGKDYYRKLPERLGDDLSPEEYKKVEELGLLGDKDDQGTLLQIFTKPLGDRPTIFIEIIQRIGCAELDENGQPFQRGGCGGFGKGNFSELFKSIEDYERMLDGSARK